MLSQWLQGFSKAPSATQTHRDLMLMCARVSSDKEHPPQNIWQGKSHTASWKPISWLGCKSKLWDSQDYNDGGWKSWIPTIWWVNKTIYKICLQHEGREKPHLTCTATHSLHSAAWLNTQKASNIHNAIHYMQLLCAPKPFCWRCPLEMSMIKCPMAVCLSERLTHQALR